MSRAIDAGLDCMEHGGRRLEAARFNSLLPWPARLLVVGASYAVGTSRLAIR